MNTDLDPSTSPAADIQQHVEVQAESGNVDVDDLMRQITPAWLSRVLSERHPGVAVLSSSIIRVVVGFSVKIWVSLSYNESGTRSLPNVLVVKAGFGRYQPINEFAYRAEMRTYRDVLPRFPIHSPRCYYAGASPDGQSTAIIIEDLSSKGVRFCHAQTPLTYDEAAAFLGVLARFHAQTWNHPALSDGSFEWANDQRKADAGLTAYQESLLTPASWQRYVRMPRGAAIPKRLHDRERFIAAFARMQERGARQPQVILVGDTHMGNLYIEADGTPGFLDFLARIAPWSQEVAYFLGGALDMLDRRTWERALLVHYLARLAEHGVAAPTFDEAWRSYCEHLLFPLNTWLLNGAEFQTEAVNTANAARLAAAVIDNGTLEWLERQD